MYDSHVNGLRGCYLTFAPVCVWLTTGNMCLKILAPGVHRLCGKLEHYLFYEFLLNTRVRILFN